MRTRVLCPRHFEKTPSCVVYGKYAYCYGGCGRIELGELGLAAERDEPPRPKEDLANTMSYIASLPVKEIRGFPLPHDQSGYYLVWPGKDYYKKRKWEAPDGNKYISPVGHPKPVFWAAKNRAPVLAVVEGEMNAMSLAAAFPEWDVCSPGSAGDFKSERTRSFLLSYCKVYRTIVIITDRDGPGTEAAICAKGLLVGRVPEIPVVLMQRDANDLLVVEGRNALRKEVGKHLPELRTEPDSA